ncbi:MAG: twin-arginine translocation signal domain-containing protein, partial [Acidimicrobiia bacterium]
MVPRKRPSPLTRREFLYLSGAAMLAAACGNGASGTTTTTRLAGSSTTAMTGEEPAVSFVEPREALSGELKIL